MTDIIDKLRALGTGYVGTTRGHTATLVDEAADVIEALRAENEKLRELLWRWTVDHWDRNCQDEMVFDDTLDALGMDEDDLRVLPEED